MRADFVAHGICIVGEPSIRHTAIQVSPGARIPSATGESSSVTSGMPSGSLDKLSTDALGQVTAGIEQYKRMLRKHIPAAVPFFGTIGKGPSGPTNEPRYLQLSAKFSW